MRLSFFSTFALAALAAANPLADKIIKLNGYVNTLEKTLVDWKGTYTGMLTVLMPTLTTNTKAFLLIGDITKSANNGGTLSEGDADKVLEALRQSNSDQPTVVKTVVDKKEVFVNLDKGWADIIKVYGGVLYHLSDEAHLAIEKAMPEDKKEEVRQLNEEGKRALGQVQAVYST